MTTAAVAEDAVGVGEVEAVVVVPAAVADAGVALVLAPGADMAMEEDGVEDAIVAPDEGVSEDAAVMKIVVLPAGAAGAPPFAGTPPSALRAARAGSAAAIPGSGMLTYESLKMSSCAPSRKLYRLLYTGGEYVPSNIWRASDRQRRCTF